MKNPFVQKMPLGTDIKIQLRLVREWLKQHRAIGLGVFLVPALTVWLLVFNTDQGTLDGAALVAEVRAVQLAEAAQAEENIYHVVKEITEGADKANYVAEVLNVPQTKTTQRTDRIETYQHSDTALALIESNGTERSFEAFLSRVHDDGNLSLHHYGPKTTEVEAARASFDQAHDLASLYTEFTSLDRPTIPVLAETAELIAIDENTNQAQFRTVLSDTITIVSFVDLSTKQTVEDIIYVKGSGEQTYEMTRVAYIEREIIPATEFESVFDLTQFEYEVIAIKETVQV